MLIEGTIQQVLPLQSGTSKAGNEWKKQSYVLQTNEQYPRTVMFSFLGDKADQYPLSVGNQVQVSFDINSREFNGRWYTEVTAYKAENIGQAEPIQQSNYDQQANEFFASQPTPQSVSTPSSDDNFPF